MNLTQAIAAAGMTPPHRIAPGRWIRFPGIGKGKANRAGWCRVITPTLAIFGDWSSNFTATWKDEAHRDDETTRRLLIEARKREQEFQLLQRQRQREAAVQARNLIETCRSGTHCYLERKGFPHRRELIDEKKNLVIPMRDAKDYAQILSAQLIAENGEKKFLPGGRAKGAVFRIGAPHASRIVLCEGFATGLSIDAALKRLPGLHAVLVCFSAKNLELVAERFPRAVVAADNDRSATGEEAAKTTGLKWTMPYEIGTDFNDLHRNMGLHVVVERMRELLS
jgi:putative DNA primase/helicase